MIGLYYIHSHRLHWHWVTIRCLTNYSNILNYVFSYIIHCILIIDLLKLLIDRFIATVMPRQREGVLQIVIRFHRHSKAIIHEYLRAQAYTFNLVQSSCHVCLRDLFLGTSADTDQR